MRVNLQHLNIRSQHGMDRWVEEQILSICESRRIDEANVRLQYRTESSPPFTVGIHLVTPGPDLFAEGSDHTWRAAFAKAQAQLRETLASRAGKRRRRSMAHSRAPGARAQGARRP